MFISYNNCKIHSTLQGKGETLLLLHGFLENISMWDDFTEQLSETHQVLCIDLLGHGKTDCLGYVHSMDVMAEAVFAVLNHINIKHLSCVGHSMGGYVALAMAEKRPTIFNALCLMNSTFEADSPERNELRLRANSMAKTNFDNLVRLSFTNLFAPESKLKFLSKFEAALNLALKTPVQGYIAAQEGMRIRPNRFEVFKNLKAKKALIISKKDWVVDAELLKSKVLNTDIEVVEFSEGHMSHIENKDNLSSFFTHFLND